MPLGRPGGRLRRAFPTGPIDHALGKARRSRPPGLPKGMVYWSRWRGVDTRMNPLQLSRLIAEDIMTDWSIPDFVPRDDKGNPLISDILPLKQMPIGEPILTEEPKEPSSPPMTDIRYFTNGWVLKAMPNTTWYMRSAALSLFGVLVTITAVFLGIK